MTEQQRERAIRLRLIRSPERRAGFLPTGLSALDSALGGGLPHAAVVELFGPSSSGKSTLALQIVAHSQKHGGTAAWIDAEHAFNPSYASQLGVTVEAMPLARPQSAEEALEIACRLAGSGALHLLVVDSAAALVPRLELESAVGDGGHGLQARVVASGLRKLSRALFVHGVVALFLNQTRSRGDEESSAGGPPLKLHAAVRVALTASGSGRVRFRVLKNKVTGAFREGEIRRREGGEFVESP